MCVILLALLENTSASQPLMDRSRSCSVRATHSCPGDAVCTKPGTQRFRHGHDLWRHADSGLGVVAVLAATLCATTKLYFAISSGKYA